MKTIRFFIILFFFSVFINYSYGQVEKISVHKKTQVLKDGKKQSIQANCYYSTAKGEFVVHYTEPKEFIKKTNKKGELKIYLPEQNKVTIKQDFYFSSQNELLHYFVNNLIDDLGLKKQGFTLADTEFDEGYMVTTWNPPENINKISNVKIVFENMIPIYSSYQDKDGEIIRKIYYSNYYKGENFILPRKITEITFTSKTDSTIKRTIYSDIKENEKVNSYYLDYEIPEDAKITK
ncbi:MAG: hypothetical protein ACQESJ_01635 [Bacteroidota bacterium]